MGGVVTLDDALAYGQGVERPFQCPVHDDSHASASVNVLKGVWYCYACRESGTVEGKKAPSVALLAAMLEPEKSCRVYPADWLNLFADPGYWLDRFPAWLCWALKLGEDPFTGDAVFPVRTPTGLLAGVGRRLANPTEDEPRYKYPLRWSASRTLGFLDLYSTRQHRAIMLTEGAADAAAGWEVGVPTFPCYGAGVHLPQLELIRRLSPQVVITGFDMDEAGDRATVHAYDELSDFCDVVQAEWAAKDPAECDTAQRVAATSDALNSVSAGLYDAIGPVWCKTQEQMISSYQTHLEEAI